MKNSEKLIPLIFLTISTFFLFYTFYESEIKYEGKEHSSYFVYYLICSILIAYSVFSLFLKRKTNINIPIIDINKDLMEKHPDPLALFPFRTFNHYNELGYKLISKTILKKIIEYENIK